MRVAIGYNHAFDMVCICAPDGTKVSCVGIDSTVSLKIYPLLVRVWSFFVHNTIIQHAWIRTRKATKKQRIDGSLRV
jgi:hypothetical protein